MCFNNHLKKIVWIFLSVTLLSLMTGGLAIAETIRVDRIVATVNDEIITLSDIDKYILFYPVFRKKDETEQQFYNRVLGDLINYKVIYLEYREEFDLREGDFSDVQTSVINKVGSYQELQDLLGRFDMTLGDFKDFIREKIVFEKVLTQNFQLKININFQEIEEFYNQQYLPAQESLQLKPKTIIEMAPLIETQLRQLQQGQRLAGWLKEVSSSYKISYNFKQEQ